MTTKLNTCLTISIQKTKYYMVRVCISSLSIGGRKCKREREGGRGEKKERGGGESNYVVQLTFLVHPFQSQ